MELTMIVSTVFCLLFISTGIAEIWRTDKLTTDWEFRVVYRNIDSSVIAQGLISKSLTGCVFFCSHVADIIVPSLLFSSGTGRCICNPGNDGTSEDEHQLKFVYATRRALVKIDYKDNSYKRTTRWPYKHGCSELYGDFHHEDGVYVIHPRGGCLTDVWCDMVKGGWTVIQRRMDGSEMFYRGWNDYVRGFGNRTGEYWLGLENIYYLTKDDSQLFIYVEGYPEVIPSNMSAYYSHFKLGNSSSRFALDIRGFTGTCGDAMTYSNGQSFTTFDNDNDRSPYNCAVVYTGAWWYKSCHFSHLNGLYYKQGVYSTATHYATGIHWYACWYRAQSSKLSLMEIK